ncbi:MAG TPA: ATP-binding protein [Acidimicrobiales bacterium]|jgi:anti-sigma regulatory factor (Ser/Thr protein kinase)
MRAITLPPDPRSARTARVFVREITGTIIRDPEVAVLLTSELVANVVRHANTELTVEVDAGPPLRISVRDGSAATAAFRKIVADPAWPHPDATSGRGLGLLHKLAVRVGLDDAPDGGKIVWFEL